ncbi:UrvD/REP family ATP-dependent DNA helicase [Rothia mucilaginosa]|uniref:UrvD/REP family ATP-dependent DNA helicase n=1 Tax=Rothia mucilaginosa TaxID=43675 RepID=UPI0027BAFDD0|nr:UrvD/REP family ATP-dependent DNA helicase [Rothia mucilaginosa]
MTTQLLTGIPGTGKTHHLTERALRYLTDGNDPARLLILAPTRTAATRMRDTIAAASDRSLSVAPTRAWAAYAFDLLKRAQTRGLLTGVEGNLKLLSGPEQDVIIGELLANHAEGIAPGPAWPDSLREALPTRGFRHEIRDFFDRMAEYDLTAEDVQALARDYNRPIWAALAQLHTEYRAVRALRAKNAYDPAVLINDACRLLLRNPEFLAEERRRYDLILIDDVQELSPSTYRLLRLIAAEEPPADAAALAAERPDVFAAAPEVIMTYSDEAVVQGFRGARPDLVRTLPESFPHLAERTLTTSYRLPALMMPLLADIRRRLPRYSRYVPAAETDGQNGQKPPATFGRINTTPADEALTWGAADEPLLHLGADGKILDPAHYRTAPAGVYKYALASAQDEANLLAQLLLEDRIYGNRPYRESAIIVRNGADVARIRRVLSASGIPSRTSAALVPVRDEPAVRPFLDALSLLVYARKRGEKALNPAVTGAGYEALSPDEAEEIMRKSLDDVIAEENRSNPLNGANSAITLLTSRLGGASSMDVRRLRQQLRSVELQTGGHRPSDDLLLGALLHPETLPAEGVGRAVHRIAAVLSAGRKALARPDSTSTEVLWALWEASGLEKTWVAQSRGAGPEADAAHRNLDAMIGLFEAASRFDEQMRGAGAEQFLDFIDAQDLPMDTLAARGVRQDAVEILTPALAAGQSWRTVYVCGLQEGTWPNTTVRGSLLGIGDLVDICDARMRRPAHANPAHANPDAQAEGEPAPPARIRSYPERVRDTRHDELRMFAVAATRASTRLVLTAVRNEDEAPGEFFDFVVPTDAENDSPEVPITRVRRPATLRSLVAELRRTLVEDALTAMSAEDAELKNAAGSPGSEAHVPEAHAPDAPDTAEDAQNPEAALNPEAAAFRFDAASRTLARLARVQAPGASPEQWWGLLPLSSTEPFFARPAHDTPENDTDGNAPDEGRRTIALSPSRLETIHNSPLDWLVSAARAEAQTDLSRSLGTLVHAIAEEYPTGTLEQLQTALEERIGSLGVPARREDESEEEYRERVPWEAYALYERAKRMILRLSYYYRLHMGDAGWQNLGVEGSFAVRVPVPFDPQGEVGELDALLTGRVDRLEEAPEKDGTRRFVIVDLKTGKSKPDGAAVANHPQLAAYQIAVEAGAGEQLAERYRAEAAAAESGEPAPDARPQELTYESSSGRSAGAALMQVGVSDVNDDSKARLQIQPALEDNDEWAVDLVQRAAELIAGAQVQTRHREGTHGHGCRLPELCPICTRGRQVTQP